MIRGNVCILNWYRIINAEVTWLIEKRELVVASLGNTFSIDSNYEMIVLGD